MNESNGSGHDRAEIAQPGPQSTHDTQAAKFEPWETASTFEAPLPQVALPMGDSAYASNSIFDLESFNPSVPSSLTTDYNFDTESYDTSSNQFSFWPDAANFNANDGEPDNFVDQPSVMPEPGEVSHPGLENFDLCRSTDLRADENQCLQRKRKASTAAVGEPAKKYAIGGPIEPAEYTQNKAALTYFLQYSLPALQNCPPRPIWDAIREIIAPHNSELCHIATAIGLQQQLLFSNVQPCESTVQSLNLAAENALKRLPPEEKVFAHLLFIILASLQRSFHLMLSHLVSGFKQVAITRSQPVHLLCHRLLRDCALNFLLCFPYTAESKAAKGLLLNDIAIFPGPLPCDPDDHHSILWNAVHIAHLKVAAFMPAFHPEVPQSQPTDFLSRRDNLRSLISLIEKRLDSALAVATAADESSYKIMKARILMLGTMLNKPMNYTQCAFDADQPVFEQILGLVDSAKQEGSAPFVLGQGLHCLILFLATRCRHASFRRRAIQALDHCPQIDGPWSTSNTRAICCAILLWEEGRAARMAADANYPPDSCRVYTHSSVTVLQDGQWKTMLRVVTRPENKHVWVSESFPI